MLPMTFAYNYYGAAVLASGGGIVLILGLLLVFSSFGSLG
jgi:hypothetical protein